MISCIWLFVQYKIEKGRMRSIALAFVVTQVLAIIFSDGFALGIQIPFEDERMKRVPMSVQEERVEMERVGSVGVKTYYWEITRNVTWIDSLNICQLKGMYMASVETEEEDRFLADAGQRLGWRTYLNIAGTDIFDEGRWRWMRSGRAFNYTNWYPGSPYPAPDGRNWNCLALDPNAPWKWVDMGCNTYICITLCEFP